MKRVNTVAKYFASLPHGARSALTDLRKTIRNAAPGATEVIWYGMPTFKLDRMLVSYAAFRDHGSFFPLSSRLLTKFKREVAVYEHSKGTIRFPFDKPLPKSLVKKLVKARIVENEQRRTGSGR